MARTPIKNVRAAWLGALFGCPTLSLIQPDGCQRGHPSKPIWVTNYSQQVSTKLQAWHFGATQRGPGSVSVATRARMSAMVCKRRRSGSGVRAPSHRCRRPEPRSRTVDAHRRLLRPAGIGPRPASRATAERTWLGFCSTGMSASPDRTRWSGRPTRPRRVDRCVGAPRRLSSAATTTLPSKPQPATSLPFEVCPTTRYSRSAEPSARTSQITASAATVD
jgi:hypothetical protein